MVTKVGEMAVKRWQGALSKLIEVTELSFLEPDQNIITAGDREMTGMYLVMSGTVGVYADEYDYERGVNKNTLVNEIQQG